MLAVSFRSLWPLEDGHTRWLPTPALPPKRSRDIRTNPAPGPSPSPSPIHEAFTPGISPPTHDLCPPTAASVSQSLDTRLQIMWNVFHESRHEGRINARLVRTVVTSCASGCPSAASERSALFNGCSAHKLFSVFFDLRRPCASPCQHNRVLANM